MLCIIMPLTTWQSTTSMVILEVMRNNNPLASLNIIRRVGLFSNEWAHIDMCHEKTAFKVFVGEIQV